MPCPGHVLARAGRPRVNLDGPLPVSGVCRDRDLQLHRPAAVQRQRRLHRQLRDLPAPGPVGRDRGQLHERRPRQQHRPADRVVSQPRHRPRRHQPGQHQPPAGQLHRRAQQRVPHRAQPRQPHVPARGRPRPRPVPLVLERVRRQLHPLPAAQHRGPVHSRAVHVRGGQGGQHRRRRRPPRAQHRDEHRPAVRRVLSRLCPAVQRGRAERGQGAVRADLDEGPHARGGQRPHRAGVPDRLPGLPRPVARLAGPGQPAGQRLRPQDPRRPVLQARRRLAQLRQHRVHPRGVERVADPQRPDPPAPLPEPLRDPRDRGGVAGDHHRRRAVHRRDRHPRHPGQRRRRLVLGRLDRGHRPAAGQRLHQPRPRRHQRARVFQRQHPRRVRRGDLPDRVPRHRVRDDPAGGQQRHQPRLDREQPRLREQRLVRPPVLAAAEDHLRHRDPQPGLQQRARPVEHRREHRRRRVQPRAHPRPLRALPGEHEPHPPRPPGRAAPVTSPAPGSPAASAPSPAASSSRPAPVTTARYSSTDRLTASDQPTSAGSRPGRAARKPARRPACAASPPAVLADTSHGVTPPSSTGTAGTGPGRTPTGTRRQRIGRAGFARG